MNPIYRVECWEMERGWGRKPWETRDFSTLLEAEAYYHYVNSFNVETTVPDWYVYAESPRRIDPGEA